MVLIAHISAPEEGLIFTTNNIQLKIGEKIIGKGKLYISQDAMAWQADNMVEGISILWKQISIHGVSANPRKCIYFMLDHKLEWRGVYDEATRAALRVQQNGNGGGGAGDGAGEHRAAPIEHQPDGVYDGDLDEGNATDEDEEQNEEQMTECWLLPDDINIVDTMFQAMTECQALHPDSGDSVSEESDFMDDDGEQMDDDALGPAGNGDDDADAAQGGMRNLHLNDDERFADADE